MQKYLFLFLCILLGGCAQSPAPKANQESSAPKIVAIPQSYLALFPPEVSIWFDSQEQPLGAYSVVLNFDPEILEISEVKGGYVPFEGTPLFNRKQFAKGKVRIMAYHTEEKGPLGQTLVARIRFKGLKTGISPIHVSVETLVTPEGVPIHPRYFVSALRVEVYESYRE